MENKKYIKLSFTGNQIIFMDTVKNPKSEYYNNSQVATVVFTNQGEYEVRLRINMKDVRMEKGVFTISKSINTLMYGSNIIPARNDGGEKPQWNNFAIQMIDLVDWMETTIPMNEF